MTTDDIRRAIADRIAEAEAGGSTRADLARRAGLPASVLSGYLGGRGARDATIAALAGVLGLELTVRPVKGWVPPEPPRRGPAPGTVGKLPVPKTAIS